MYRAAEYFPRLQEAAASDAKEKELHSPHVAENESKEKNVPEVLESQLTPVVDAPSRVEELRSALIEELLNMDKLEFAPF